MKPDLLFKFVWLFAVIVALSRSTHAEAVNELAIVKLPLSDYDRLIEASRDAGKEHRPPPASFALGKATLQGTIVELAPMPVAHVTLILELDVLENEWTEVPILPAGTSVVHAEIDAAWAQLTSTPRGVFWNTNKAGHYVLTTEFRINALRSIDGFSVQIPTPQAASITFDGILPQEASDIAVIPSAGTEISATVEKTQHVQSTIPSSAGFLLSWKTPLTRGYAVNRAEYRGILKPKEKAILWSGIIAVELFGKESVNIALLPSSTTLSDVRLDEKPSSILVEQEKFVTRVEGQGAHTIRIEFQTPIIDEGGAPRAELSIPRIPISRFELEMPERKELSVEPHSNVTYREEKNSVVATVYAPMSDTLSFSWKEAVPEESKEDLRANAMYIHTAYAEEGVLYLKANASYEITRGATSSIEFDVLKGVQINRITSAAAIADWRISSAEEGKVDRVQVFFEHELNGLVAFDVEYDFSFSGEQGRETIPVPLIHAVNVHRQRGMLALLSGKEVGLRPVEEIGLTKVGENQLPASIREGLDKTVSHTYKYGDVAPMAKVQTAKPERREGKFDANVNTLISLSDVTMSAAASIELNVKAGSLDELQIELPANVNFLGLTAPSLRNHRVSADGSKQTVFVQFTQEMEGQFRLEASYEKILSEGDSDISTPTLNVRGAEIQQGKIAIEAVSAVEVQATRAEQLSTLDPSELPQQLLLKTTNPILLAFSYLRADPPHQLAIKITRHREIEVQAAAIDTAQYSTLFTSDGLAVTTARFMVRNNRKQFLKVDLPRGAIVWSAAVDNVAEKPALAHDPQAAENLGPQVLLKIITSAQAFPVELIYQTPIASSGSFGSLEAMLPRPDMVVTDSLWNVYLPEQLNYGRPRSNMRLVENARIVGQQEIVGEVGSSVRSAKLASAAPLRVAVPVTGIRYSFQKLYANQSREETYISIPYGTFVGKSLAVFGLIVATLFMLQGISNLYRKRRVTTALVSMLCCFCLGAYLIEMFGIDYRIVAGIATVWSFAQLSMHVYRRTHSKVTVDGLQEAAGSQAG